MQSAFGVEHGLIEKARRRKKPTAAQQATMPKPHTQAGPTLGRRTAGRLNQIGETPVSIKGVGRGISGGLARTSGFVSRRPGLVGAAAVGGAGFAGYKYLRGTEPPKRKTD